MRIEELEVKLKQERLIAIVRSRTAEIARVTVQQLVEAGVKLIELTWTTPRATELLVNLTKTSPSVVWGAGTILSPAQAEEAIAAGADFIVSPDFNGDVRKVAAEACTAYIPGVWTANEVAIALRSGLSVLKLFPAQSGGIRHLQSLHEPYPQVQFVPTGGVTPSNSLEWIAAGAMAVGIGGALSRLPVDEMRHIAATLRLLEEGR